MMKLAAVVAAMLVFAGCGSGNGNGDGQHGQDMGIQPAVWYCVSITKADRPDHYPCFQLMDECEANRAGAQSVGSDVGECWRHSFAMCYRASKGKTFRDLCSQAKQFCETERKIDLDRGFSVGECLRTPPE
jgi:hypothetical protein